ncbi:MAG: cytochrome o ubiquinol oxidase subunit IV [Betaproteobacteria bacterium]|nr:cytochrome o ubiquinol oxidase subunit IV [Betaproteobacteria bacterium]MDE2622660.1 cytochrome o ubiquinol oxidase subunit IV [Betaproteobacteria bacterium]
MAHHSYDSSGASHGSLKSYATGFLLSLILTVISFGLVMDGMLQHGLIMACIVAAAVIQMIVQVHYFLHLDTSSAQRWNVMALLYTVLIVAILVGGTIWIMANSQSHMMHGVMPMGH